MTCLIYTTWPDRQSADKAINSLLEQRLIACANILGTSQSVYRWEGQVTQDEELCILFKTPVEKAEQVRDQIERIHPYETPCILTLPADKVLSSQGFQDWLLKETS